jgi:hypothetical protein
MSFVVEVVKSTTVRQGLTSSVRTSKAKAGKPSLESFDICVRVGVVFTDKQLNKQGRYVDTDAFSDKVQAKTDYLASETWTVLFDFRPTFEMVAKWLCDQLQSEVKQLEYVEIENKTLGVTTQYIP